MAKDQKKFSMLINLNRCVGCYACQVTCKAEHGTSLGAFRCRLEQHSQGSFPGLRKFFLPRLCNHCDNPPCVRACDENALSKNIDGVVVINRETCTACLACVDKCPYNAIAVDQFKGEPEKCDFCYSRIIRGELPVCAMSCMGKAIIFGDLNDENSDIFVALKKSRLKVLKPELGTHPSVFYTFSGDFAGSSLNDYDPTARPAALEMSATQNKAPLEAGGSTARMVNTSDVMCPSECGISVLVEDGMAKKISGNKHSLVNSGAFCAKGASGLQMTYSPHRIRSPLIRAGARGEERWKEASWEEAIDYISKKLIKIKKKHGPESVFLDLGDVTDREALSRLFHAFGTPNTFNHGSICDPNRKWGPWLMTGDERPLPDLQRPLLIRRGDQNLLNNRHDAKFIVNLGVNPFVATRFNYMSAAIPAAREENGCAYIVIDPSHTNSAALSDMWFPIRPGTDGDLLAAMLHYILRLS
jgi:Fe-S-cluster-containing dehydrogenase component